MCDPDRDSTQVRDHDVVILAHDTNPEQLHSHMRIEENVRSRYSRLQSEVRTFLLKIQVHDIVCIFMLGSLAYSVWAVYNIIESNPPPSNVCVIVTEIVCSKGIRCLPCHMGYWSSHIQSRGSAVRAV